MSGFLFAKNVAYLPNLQAAVIMEGKAPARAVRKTVGTPAVAATEPQAYSYDIISNIAPWGEDNLFPQHIVELAERNTELPSLLWWKSRAAMGKEILPYTRSWDEAKNDWVEKPILDSDIWDFFQRETTKRYFREAYSNFYWFWNVFPDLIKNDEGDQIAYLGTHEASWCRWYQMNEKGTVDKAAVCSNWAYGLNKTDKYWMDMPVIDPYQWNVVEAVKADQNLKRFIYPTSAPSPDRCYYQLAPWDAIRTSGWLDLAAKVPAFKQAIMKNQMHIKYLIKIPTTYWPSVYPDWENFDDDKKLDKKKEQLQLIEQKLTNVESAGRSILNEIDYDDAGKPLPGWAIEKIDSQLNDGAYIEDSQEASAHLLRALGLDGTLVGSGPGRDLNAGGGSDKLIAYNMYVALLGSERDVVMAPAYFVARYNGWMERYPFFFIKTVEAAPQALDTSKKVSYETQKQDAKN